MAVIRALARTRISALLQSPVADRALPVLELTASFYQLRRKSREPCAFASQGFSPTHRIRPQGLVPGKIPRFVRRRDASDALVVLRTKTLTGVLVAAAFYRTKARNSHSVTRFQTTSPTHVKKAHRSAFDDLAPS